MFLPARRHGERKRSLLLFVLFFPFSLSVSHFYIGQCQVDNIKLSIFRYCQPVPFLALTSNGLYKRMRWNVKRTREGNVEIKLDSKEERDDNRAKEMEGDQEAKKGREMDNSTE